MSTHIKIKPGKGFTLLNTDASKVPEEGINVELTQFWLRRLADGSAVIHKEDPEKPVKIKPEKTKSIKKKSKSASGPETRKGSP